MHVGLVERGQVVVVETDALAVLAVPGLELLGGLGILDGLFDPSAKLGHHLEVGPVELAPLLGALGLDVGVLPEDLRPAVAHQILLGLLAGHRGGEVAHALLLPARLEALEPLLVGGAVVPHADRRRRPLEDVDVLGSAGEVGHDLDGGRAGTDDADALVGELVHRRRGAAAGVGVVPSCGVERPPGEGLDALDAGQLRLVEDAARGDEEPGADPIAARGRDVPRGSVVVPLGRLHLGLEERVVVEVEVPSDPLAVLEDLGRARVLLGGHVARLFEQRHVGVGLDVALQPG